MRNRFISLIIVFLSLLLLTSTLTSSISLADVTQTRPIVRTIRITDVITNGTTEYVKRGIALAESNNAAALVLLIDTPGGIVDATLEIIEAMMGSTIPVITYVEPQGAIAASAGSFILIGGHIAAMSPGTTCGAAMPVTFSLSEEGTASNPADDKTINFLAGHIRSIAEEKGRNGDTAELFVTENLTLNANEALEKKVIDLISRSLQVLLEEVDGMVIDLQGVQTTLHTTNAIIEPIDLTTREKATGILSNPQVSFMLVLLGVYGLIIGFNAPHTYIPEVAGAIALVTGLFGLGMFDVNIFAGLIIVLGIILLIAEVLTPTYGVLSVAGVISIVIGGFFLPREPLMPAVWFVGLRSLSIGIGISASILMLVVLKGLIRIRNKPPFHNIYASVTQIGVIIEADRSGYLVKVNGEIWHGVAEENTPLEKQQRVQILDREGLSLILSPVSPSQDTQKEGVIS